MQTDPELSDEIRRFEEQYAENPDSLVFARLADLHRKAGRPERALEILDEGLERHPDYLSAHIVRARCLRALDRRQESEEVFGHVLELDGENLVALRSLAEMAWERGDGEKARERLRELLELDPSNEEARDLLEEIREGPEEGSGEAFAREEDDVAGEAGLGSEDEFGWEDDFGAEDDPFAGGGEAGATADDDAADADDDAARSDDDGARSDAYAAGEGEPADRERRDDEDLIIEPTSRRERSDDREAFDERERSDDREPEPGEAGEPERAPADATGARAFDVEAVETAPEAEEPGSEAAEEPAAEEPAGEATGGPAPDAAEGEGSGRWWDFLGSGGEDETSEARPEADGEAVASEPEATIGSSEPDEATREPAPDDGPASPAVGPASEAEELRAQIEELRMQAEQETDLSDAEEDLATETLANLYEAQGFYREAVEMYEELAEQRPDDEDLRRRLERARNALEATEEASARGAEEAVGPADAEERPTGRGSTVSAAEELRSVLRGDASPEGRGTAGP